MKALLCLDGPENGSWLTPEQASPLGYHVDTWPTGEAVLTHTALDAEPDFEASV